MKQKIIHLIKEWWHIPASILTAYILGGVLFIFGFVPTGSMEPNYEPGCLFFGSRLVNEEKMECGDPLLFYFQQSRAIYLKRIIGTPGDTIEFDGGKVYVNGAEIDESEYIPDEVLTYPGDNVKFVVPDDCFFVLGDNRMNSHDSRYWDYPFVPYESVVGTPVFSVYIPILANFLTSAWN